LNNGIHETPNFKNFQYEYSPLVDSPSALKEPRQSKKVVNQFQIDCEYLDEERAYQEIENYDLEPKSASNISDNSGLPARMFLDSDVEP